MEKIVIFSDLHYAPEKPINNGSKIDRKLMEYAEPLLDKLTNEINNIIKPDLVLNLGDLVEDFNDHDKDIVNLNYVWQKFKKIDAPFYSCIGNHDLRSMSSRKEVEEIMEYGHSTFSLDIFGMHIVILGTYVNNELGTSEGGIFKTQFISNEDLEWLKEDLRNNKLPSIICLHFGVAEDDMKGNWWFETCPETALLGNRNELKQIIREHKNVLAVFSGHQHWTKYIKEDGISYYVLGSLTENINNDGVPDGVYFIVEFDGKNLNVVEQHLSL
ncbi:MAG: metallophosphoesterase [Clostridia bacterium]|nr:metallophosphoesterase [Clostridia bacterium]